MRRRRWFQKPVGCFGKHQTSIDIIPIFRYIKGLGMYEYIMIYPTIWKKPWFCRKQMLWCSEDRRWSQFGSWRRPRRCKRSLCDSWLEIRIESLGREDPRLKEVALLNADGFRGKRCCLCIGDSQAELECSLRSAAKWVPDAKLEGFAVAMAGDQTVGFAQLGFHDTPGDVMLPVCFRNIPAPDTCHLERIVVSHSMRGKGLGTKLLNWVDEKARQRGCKHVMLEVVSNNPAKKLYEKHGYVSRTGACQKVYMCPLFFCATSHLYYDEMYKTLWAKLGMGPNYIDTQTAMLSSHCYLWSISIHAFFGLQCQFFIGLTANYSNFSSQNHVVNDWTHPQNPQTPKPGSLLQREAGQSTRRPWLANALSHQHGDITTVYWRWCDIYIYHYDWR